MMSFCTPRNQPYMKDTLFKKYPRKSKRERDRGKRKQRRKEDVNRNIMEVNEGGEAEKQRELLK